MIRFVQEKKENYQDSKYYIVYHDGTGSIFCAYVYGQRRFLKKISGVIAVADDNQRNMVFADRGIVLAYCSDLRIFQEKTA